MQPLLLVVLFLRKSEQREFGEVDSPNPDFTHLSSTADDASKADKTFYPVVGVALLTKANA
ncbi:hypothetical protein [Nostoc sp.]|uniref:hypothetical protein n=1 Tax=Nostoc sp. TaxID=1180 RepID=UPI002FFA798A